MTPEQLVRKVTAITGYTHAAGVEVVTAEPGNVTLSLAKKPELLQFNGFFHGGVVSGLADHAAGAAATTGSGGAGVAGGLGGTTGASVEGSGVATATGSGNFIEIIG